MVCQAAIIEFREIKGNYPNPSQGVRYLALELAERERAPFDPRALSGKT
jgi:hypothetical protein